MQTTPSPAADPPRLRMRDLCEQSGMQRQAIHFYIQQGLLPPGHKTGRNTAYYTAQHVQRLEAIRRLQTDQLLPLKAIRTVFDAHDAQPDFTPAQRQFLLAAKAALRPSEVSAQPLTPLTPLRERLGLPESDLRDLTDEGLIQLHTDDAGVAHVRARDVPFIELAAALRRIGLTKDLGFSAADYHLIDLLFTALFRVEISLITSRLSGLPTDEATAITVQAIPLMNQLILHFHNQKIHDFLTAL